MLGAGLDLAPTATRSARGGVAASLDLSFLYGVLDPGITFTRASTATYTDSSGVLQTASTNTPRFDYDPVTGAARGLLIEEARTNILLNSAALITQTVTVTAQAYTLSFYGTGTVTLTGASTAGPLAGTGAAARVSLTFTPAAGSLTLTVSGSVTNANLEAGSFATSWVPTVGSPAARAADNAYMPVGPWHNASQGTLYSEARMLQNAVTNAKVIASLNLASVPSNNRISLIVDAGLTAAYTRFTAAGVASEPPAYSLAAGGIVLRQAIGYQAGSAAATVNGTTPTTSAPAAVPTVDRLDIGHQGNQFHANGWVRRIKYFPSRLPNATLQSITT